MVLPWISLVEAEEKLLAARRRLAPDDPAALIDQDLAAMDVRSAKTGCGALVAELLLHARGEDGIADFVRRLLNSFGLIDDDARNWIANVADGVQVLSGWVTRLRDENWELVERIKGLEAQMEGLLHEREDAEQVEQAGRHLRAARTS